jgi:hypothetical protein
VFFKQKRPAWEPDVRCRARRLDQFLQSTPGL